MEQYPERLETTWDNRWQAFGYELARRREEAANARLDLADLNPRVLKLMIRFTSRSRNEAVAATRFDSCQMAKIACPWKTGGPEVRAVAATSRR